VNSRLDRSLRSRTIRQVMLGPVRTLVETILRVGRDLVVLISSAMRSRARLAAENLFLRKQLALYLERQVKPRRADDATRITLVALSPFVDWRHLLTVVKPETLIRWHRQGFRLWWRWKSRARGRPPIPVDLQQLIATMAAENRTWGEERIADELLLKLGIRVSPRTIRRYIRRDHGARHREHRPGAPSYGTTPERCSRVISLSSSQRPSAFSMCSSFWRLEPDESCIGT